MADAYTNHAGKEAEYFFNVNENRLFTRNSDNYINRLGRDNINTLGNVSLLDIYLSNAHVVEPHYHKNASELVYCISGAAEVSFINPFTNEVTNIQIAPGEVANIPQGWWHWEEAEEDNTHLLAIFDAPYPEYIFGSDLLTKTPVEVFAHTYCLDPAIFKEAIAPLHGETIIIGPTDECEEQMQVQGQSQQQHKANQQYNTNQMQQMPYTMPYYVCPPYSPQSYYPRF